MSRVPNAEGNLRLGMSAREFLAIKMYVPENASAALRIGSRGRVRINHGGMYIPESFKDFDRMLQDVPGALVSTRRVHRSM